MLTITLTCGAPASGKSSWAKAEVAKDPNNYCRINNDDIRAMLNGSVYSAEYEKMITDVRNYLISDAIKRNKHVIVDNVNANRRHFETVCRLAKESNRDVKVFEKVFYEELSVLLERDAKREGKSQVGEVVVKKWFKELGGTQHKHYKPRVEVFVKRTHPADAPFDAAVQNKDAPKAIISDLDGTLSLLNGRNPYDATNCFEDLPNIPVVETVKLFHSNGYKVVFCSGREDKYEDATRQFIGKYLPNVEYDLFMRKTSDMRRDSVIKEEIYEGKIKDKFNVLFVLDDRMQVVSLWRELGLTCFQVAPGDF